MLKHNRRQFISWFLLGILVIPNYGQIFRRSNLLVPLNPSGSSPIAIDASSPIRFSNTAAINTDITSASFTPPNNSVLVICVSGDTPVNTAETYSASVTTGSSPVLRVSQNGNTGGGQGGYAGIFTSIVTTGAAMTTSVRHTTTASTFRISVKVYVLTGANTTIPNGATQNGRSTVNNLTSTAYTSTVNNSRGFGCGTDWNALGAGVLAPTSTDTGDGATYNGQIDVLSCYKAANTASSGSSVTLNFDAAGVAAAEWHWATLEIVP